MLGWQERILVSLLVVTFVWCGRAAAQPRPVPDRPGIFDIGEPFSINRATLAGEMRRNDELRLFVGQYGYPDYAEIQEIVPTWPWYDYEVRIYYIDREQALAFGRVFLSSDFPNFGSRKSLQKLRPEVIDRLLTARPIGGRGAVATSSAAPQAHFVLPDLVAPNPQMDNNQPPMEPHANGDESPDVQIETHDDGVTAAPVIAQQ